MQNAAPKCANCGEAHSAAYKKCRKFEEVQRTLKVVASQRISYKDALVQIRSKPVAITEVDREAVRGWEHPPVAVSVRVDAASVESLAIENGQVVVDQNTTGLQAAASIAQQPAQSSAAANTSANASEAASSVWTVIGENIASQLGNKIITMESFCRFFVRFLELIRSSTDKSALSNDTLAAAIEMLGVTREELRNIRSGTELPTGSFHVNKC